MGLFGRRGGGQGANAPAPASSAPQSSSKPASGRRLSWRARAFASLSAIGALGVTLWLAGMLVYYTIVFPNPLAVRAKEGAPVVRIVARDGTLLGTRGAALDYVPIDLVPKHVIDAVVATEDRRFFHHWGIDPAGLVRASFANLRAGRFVQGGSTLTQQLAKNLFLSPERTMSRKLDELALAIWLEVRLTKREILELYLNRVYFGGGAYGIEAAAQRYFDKSVRALSVAEAALMAGLLKAPSKFSPLSNPDAAIARGKSVLAKMWAADLIDEGTYHSARSQQVRFADVKSDRSTTGFEYALDVILEKLPPLLGDEQTEMIVETTIDAQMQRRANAVVQSLLDGRGSEMGVGQAALVTLDVDGGIRALIGGRSYAESQFNRAIKAQRQPGSVFKPFVYLAAIERGMTPDTITYDMPLTIDNWSPRNDNNKHVGALTLRQALAQSVNTVAVRLATDVGLGRVTAAARRLGIEAELREDASLALGTSEVSLMELAAAYTVFANGGQRVEPHVIRRVRLSNGRVLFARAATPLQTVVALHDVGAMNDMLNATLVEGTGKRAALPRHAAAGKTGTTQDHRDAWFIGYTAHMTTGVWLGNDDGSPMGKVMGGNLPAEIWREVMTDAHRDLKPLALAGTAAADAFTAASATETSSTRSPTRADADVSATQSRSERASGTIRAAAARPHAPAVIGQRLVIEPPKIVVPPVSRAAGNGSGSRWASEPTTVRHPKERISEDFLARVLEAPDAQSDVGVAVAESDIDARAPLLTGAPRALRPPAPAGLMALGAGLPR